MTETNTVLEVLSEWLGCENTIGFWLGYKVLEDETKIPKKILQKIMAILRTANIVEYTSTVDLDGVLHGSGYFLHDEYIGKSYEQIMEGKR